jgi:uncharacterized protein with NAD-binding domain and iron-sulfur cluster
VIKDYIDTLIKGGALTKGEKSSFEKNVIKQVFNINENDHSVQTSTVTSE